MKSRVVYKYPLVPFLELPKGAKILCVGAQENPTGIDFLWVEVDPTETIFETRKFECVFTGVAFGVSETEDYVYLGTIHSKSLLGKSLVDHVFEVVPRK